MNAVTPLRVHAARDPDRTAIVDGATRLDYGHLDRAVDHTAGRLRAAGVDRNDRVAVALCDSAGALVTHFAALRLGAVVCPLDPRSGADTVAAQVDDVAPDAAVVPEGGSPHAAALPKPRIPVNPTVDPPDGDVERVADATRANDDTAHVLFTSGTSGCPKGLRITHGARSAHSETLAATIDLGRDDVTLCALPLSTNFAHAMQLFPALAVGATTVLQREWNAETALSAMAEEAVTWFCGVPTMFHDLLEVRDGGLAPESLRVLLPGGGPTAPADARALEETFDAPVLLGYGLSEVAGRVTCNPLAEDRRLDTAGMRYLGQVELRDPETREPVPTGETGEIAVASVSLIDGYLDDCRTREAFDDEGWFHTGDVGRWDDEHLVVAGRVDDRFVCGGQNLYPAEIEACIAELDGVDAVAVVPEPDDRKGAVPVAYVVSRYDSLSTDAVRDHVIERLHPNKHPRRVHFRRSLPRTDVGKVDRDALTPEGKG